MKPDRKQPGRAAAMPDRANTQGSAQEPLQSQDWYVIADEGELTLRISDGLRVGEDRWGELTLNHPLSAHRWLEFSIDSNGELWCRSSRKDIAVRCDGVIQDEVLLDAGVPIALPHNLLHISDNIRRGNSSSWQLQVGLIEAAQDSTPTNFDSLVDTEAEITPVPEPRVTPQAQTSQAAPPPGPQEAGANDSLEPLIPTLETVVVAPREVASEQAGPAIERAVAKLKNRSKAFGEPRSPATSYGDRGLNRASPGSADSIESALVPVDAQGPFHTDEIRAALQRPIQVSEAQQPTAANRNAPIYTPSITTNTLVTVPDNRLRLMVGVAITILLIVGAALFFALTAGPDDPQQRSLATGNKSKPALAAEASEPKPASVAAQPAPTTSESRTTSLLQTASALLSNPEDLQADTLDFAIRSLNLVLAAQPHNLEAQTLLVNAEQIRTERNRVELPARPEPQVFATDSQAQSTNSVGSYRYQDPRLAKAAELIAQGTILAPRDNSAISLIMEVLAEDPSRPDAVRLLNRSASVLVAQADEEYATLGVYAARNTLEEVLSFHPKHGPANERWRAWVTTGWPIREFPQSQPQDGVELEVNPANTP